MRKPRLATGKEMATFYSRKTRIDTRPKSQRTRAAAKRQAIKESQ